MHSPIATPSAVLDQHFQRFARAHRSADLRNGNELLIPNVLIGPGWSSQVATVRVVIPDGYPFSPPREFRMASLVMRQTTKGLVQPPSATLDGQEWVIPLSIPQWNFNTHTFETVLTVIRRYFARPY